MGDRAVKKSDIIDIIERRRGEHIRTMQQYERGSAYDRAAAAQRELFDLLLEIERTEEEQRNQRREKHGNKRH